MKTSVSLYSNIRHVIKEAFGKYLFATNVISSGVLMAAGDAVEQILELKFEHHAEGLFSWKRTIHMAAVGLLIGGPQHFFYGYLDQYLPGHTKKTVFKKILFDQFLASPASIIIFFYTLGILENRNLSSGQEELKRKFTTVYVMDWFFWAPTQYINFFYLSPKYRVLYVNALTMLYDVFLSYIKFIHVPAGLPGSK